MTRKIRVLIVDDSLFIRQMFSKILSDDDGIEVIGVAENAYIAREKIKSLNPDVITLDIEMPGLDGISFLKKIMSLRPMPVVMVSSLTQKGANTTMQALEIGAVDYVPKSSSTDFDVDNLAHQLIEKVKAASKANVRKIKTEAEKLSLLKSDSINLDNLKFKDDIIFAIGASTGGVESIKEVVEKLPANFPPIVITQHMPEKFTKSFAERLNLITKMSAKEAESGDVLTKGWIYIAEGGKQLKVVSRGKDYICLVKKSGKVTGHEPSVDVLFKSVAEHVGKKAYGIILTGMGKDGMLGMLEMHKKGSFNIGQDESTSIVYGMPKAAYLAGAVSQQLALEKIASRMIELAKV